MVVQHNLAAMNSNRMLGITSGKQAKSSEKLASGYRINRAADDAAGLSISEKMRKQMKGLDRASTNAQDGISAVQTAEGALAEVHSMLQRMNELAVQAANGTNSTDDRKAIQAEVEQLATEIDRVAETTKFNESYLLKGANDTKTVYIDAKDAGLKGTLVQGGNDTSTFTMDIKVGETVAIAGSDYRIVDENVNHITTVQNKIWDSANSKVVDALKDKDITINGSTYTYVAEKDNGGNITKEYYTDSVGTSYTGDQLVALIGDGAVVKIEGQTDAINVVDKDADDARTVGEAIALVENALKDASSIGGNQKAAEADCAALADDGTVNNNGSDTYVFTITKAEATVQKDLTFSLHVGADTDMNNKIMVNISPMDTEGLGIHGISVADNTGIAATYAIDAIADAIAKVSEQRSTLGAVQNRLEHTIANLDNVVENTTAAESRIRDTDMAEEMVEFSKNNILAQAGQSMLAQANQSTQGVLSILG